MMVVSPLSGLPGTISQAENYSLSSLVEEAVPVVDGSVVL